MATVILPRLLFSLQRNCFSIITVPINGYVNRSFSAMGDASNPTASATTTTTTTGPLAAAAAAPADADAASIVNNNDADEAEPKEEKKRKNKKMWANKLKRKKEYFEKNAEKFATTGTWRREDQNMDPSLGSFRNKDMQELFGVTVQEDDIVEEKEDEDTEAPRGKKKVAMLLAFSGSKYAGFQINPQQNTIQAQLELALYKARLILPTNFGYPHKYSWSSSARTDKGVHAVAQVCSAKLELGDSSEEEVRNRINETLPKDIRVLDIKRTTRNFCAKNQRSRVRYQYMIPSFLLYPKEELRTLFAGIGCANNGRTTKDPLTPEEINQLKPILTKYKATPDQLQKLQSALTQYEGTKPYHNFTRNLKIGDQSAKRYIIEFVTEPPMVMEDGTEWIPTLVTGQSFLLNQIRKMVSMAVDVARGAATPDQLDQALDMVYMKTGLAPAQGLFLDMSDFSAYNDHKRNEDLPDLDWMQNEDSDAMQRRKVFKEDCILKHIGREEATESNFIKYLYLMDHFFEYEVRKDNTHENVDPCNDDDDGEDVSEFEEGPQTKVTKIS